MSNIQVEKNIEQIKMEMNIVQGKLRNSEEELKILREEENNTAKKQVLEIIKKGEKHGELLKYLIDEFLGLDFRQECNQNEEFYIHTVSLKKFMGIPDIQIIHSLFYEREKNELRVSICVKNFYIESNLYYKSQCVCRNIEIVNYYTIFKISESMIKNIDSLKGLQIDKLASYQSQLFNHKPQFKVFSLYEDIDFIDLNEEKCCVCYEYTRTKVQCCKASVCKVCLINIAYTINNDADLGELNCPHCRKNNRSTELNWRFLNDDSEEYVEYQEEIDSE